MQTKETALSLIVLSEDNKDDSEMSSDGEEIFKIGNTVSMQIYYFCNEPSCETEGKPLHVSSSRT